MSSHRLSECEQNHLRPANNNSVEPMNEHISERRGRRRAGAESLRAPINHCNNRPISRYLQTREHVFTARTTQSVLTHLDSSTFARPLWAKNIKISFIAASLCVSLRRRARDRRRRHARTAQQLIATWHFYFIRSLPGILRDTCQWRHYQPACRHLIYYLKRARHTPPPDSYDLYHTLPMHRL